MSRTERTPRKGSALARPIDIGYRSNLAALVLSSATGIATGAVLLVAGDFELARPFWTGVAAFLAWAISRELAPDHPAAAAAAIPVAGLITIWGEAFVGLGVMALLAARVWAGTVGLHPSLIDFAAGTLIAAYIATDAALWLPGLAFGIGIIALSRHRGEAAAAVVAMAAIASSTAAVIGTSTTADITTAEIAVVAGFALVILGMQPIARVRSVTDRRAQPIAPWRVSAAWLAALGSVTSAVVFSAIPQSAAVLAAMVATAPVHLRARLVRRSGRSGNP
jgi:hypothetical protein